MLDIAKINCPKDYNYWIIILNAGIQPDTEKERYVYDEKNEVLQVDISQEKLERALSEYDHHAWLEELEVTNNPKTEIEVLKERLEATELALIELMMEG